MKRHERDRTIGRVTLVVLLTISGASLILTQGPLWMISIMIGLVVLAIEDKP